MDDVNSLARAIDTRCRCAPMRMWETERTSQSPGVCVSFSGETGEKNADTFISEANSRGWVTRREGPNRVYVDPDPGYRTHEELTRKPSASF